MTKKKEIKRLISKYPWTVGTDHRGEPHVGGMEYNEEIYLKTMRSWEQENAEITRHTVIGFLGFCLLIALFIILGGAW